MSTDVGASIANRVPVGFALPHWNPKLEMVVCIACGRQGACRFLEPSERPLATVWWPESEAAATDMTRLPHDFMRCVSCGHVFNKSFTYDNVPYSRKANLMFNAGVTWQGHLNHVLEIVRQRLTERPTVVEIGCGDGSLLRALARLLDGGRFVGFDPNLANHRKESVEFRGELFIANLHLPELQPELIVCRHVLEHLQEPMRFLEQIAVVAELSKQPVLLYAEVPCVDRAIDATRLSDYYYEHNSHFTSQSFRAMIDRVGGKVDYFDRFYDDEVLGALVAFAPSINRQELFRNTERHRLNSRRSFATIRRQLDGLADGSARVAIWGGTGKAAAFMSLYSVDKVRFPLVVDSDPDKCDTYVPGTGQRIASVEVLLDHPADVILIPMPWRARDILREMQAKGIGCQRVLIEHDCQLVDFLDGITRINAEKEPLPVGPFISLDRPERETPWLHAPPSWG